MGDAARVRIERSTLTQDPPATDRGGLYDFIHVDWLLPQSLLAREGQEIADRGEIGSKEDSYFSVVFDRRDIAS